MRKNSKGFAPILVLILIALVGIGAYYLGMQKGKPTPTQSTISSMSPAPEIPANWKTYTNAKYSFTIKYPANWKIQEPTGKFAVDTVTFTSPETLQVMANNAKLKTQEGYIYVQADVSVFVDPANHQLYPTGDTLISQEKINNQNFYFVKGASDPPYLYYATLYKNSLYDIDLSNIQTPEAITTTEKQIISTFKFVEPVMNGSATDRKFGFIKSITKSGASYNISVDLAQYLTGYQPDGYRIDNPTHELTIFPLEQNAQTLILPPNKGNQLRVVSLGDFIKYASDTTLNTNPYWFDTTNGTITKISEQFIP